MLKPQYWDKPPIPTCLTWILSISTKVGNPKIPRLLSIQRTCSQLLAFPTSPTRLCLAFGITRFKLCWAGFSGKARKETTGLTRIDGFGTRSSGLRAQSAAAQTPRSSAAERCRRSRRGPQPRIRAARAHGGNLATPPPDPFGGTMVLDHEK